MHHASIRAACSREYTAEQVEAWTYQTPVHFRWALLRGDEWYVVAERDERIVGFSSLKGDLLQAIYVDPLELGSGVGRRLVARVEREARRRGTTRLRLKASLNAVGFYRRLGFEGRRNGHLHTLAGIPLPYVAMRKDLVPRLDAAPSEATRRVLREHSEANRRHRLHLGRGRRSVIAAPSAAEPTGR